MRVGVDNEEGENTLAVGVGVVSWLDVSKPQISSWTLFDKSDTMGGWHTGDTEGMKPRSLLGRPTDPFFCSSYVLHTMQDDTLAPASYSTHSTLLLSTSFFTASTLIPAVTFLDLFV